jgi:hypothetical protein
MTLTAAAASETLGKNRKNLLISYCPFSLWDILSQFRIYAAKWLSRVFFLRIQIFLTAI